VTKILLGADDLVGQWVLAQQGAKWIPGRGSTFGVVDSDGRLIAGILFDSWNGASVQMHVAALPGANWVSKALLAVTFDYPFNQLGVKKILGLVGSGNSAAKRFDEHVGFELEATLNEAHPDGALLVYSMTREKCRWLSLSVKESSLVKAQRPTTA
jgi:RimJ/RimL family protein N-acetyltransferase